MTKQALNSLLTCNKEAITIQHLHLLLLLQGKTLNSIYLLDTTQLYQHLTPIYHTQ